MINKSTLNPNNWISKCIAECTDLQQQVLLIVEYYNTNKTNCLRNVGIQNTLFAHAHYLNLRYNEK